MTALTTRGLLNQIVAGQPADLGVTFTGDDGLTAVDPGVVTVTITRADGTTVTPPTVTVTGGMGEDDVLVPWVAEMTLSAAVTAQVDRLRIVWTPSTSGLEPLVTMVDVLGDLLFTVAEAVVWDGGALEDVDAAVLTDARARIAEAFHRICGVAFGTRYGLGIVSDGGGYSGGLLLNHDLEDAAFAGLPVLRLTALRSVETRTAIGGAWTAYSGDELGALEVLPSGMVVRDTGSWPTGIRRIRVGFEHGYPRVPLEVRRAALRLLRFQVIENDIPSRATSMNSEDGTFTLATAGMRGAWFGLPEVDSVLDRFRVNVPVIR